MKNEDNFIEKLNEYLEENKEVKQMVDTFTSAFDSNSDEFMDIECIEIDGEEYLILKEFNVKGTTYVHLVNANDPEDFMYRKIVVEDGEEYLYGLDSDAEFDMVIAYEQKYLFKELKRKQQMMSDNEN